MRTRGVKKLIKKWEEETRFMSSTNDMLKVGSALTLLAIGEEAIPHIIHSIKKEYERGDCSHLDVFLYELTDYIFELPEHHLGKVMVINKVWLDWYDHKSRSDDITTYCNNIKCNEIIKLVSKINDEMFCPHCGVRMSTEICTKCDGSGVEWPGVYDRRCCECSGVGVQANCYPTDNQIAKGWR